MSLGKQVSFQSLEAPDGVCGQATHLGEMFRHRQNLLPEAGLDRLADAVRKCRLELRSGLGKGFDLVTARAVLHHVANEEAALANLVASVRPGGAILLIEPDFIPVSVAEPPEVNVAMVQLIAVVPVHVNVGPLVWVKETNVVFAGSVSVHDAFTALLSPLLAIEMV